jgi:hypothetical protein
MCSSRPSIFCPDGGHVGGRLVKDENHHEFINIFPLILRWVIEEQEPEGSMYTSKLKLVDENGIRMSDR